MSPYHIMQNAKNLFTVALHKTSFQYRVEVYLKPVYSTDVHNTAFSNILSFCKLGCLKSQQLFRNLSIFLKSFIYKLDLSRF